MEKTLQGIENYKNFILNTELYAGCPAIQDVKAETKVTDSLTITETMGRREQKITALFLQYHCKVLFFKTVYMLLMMNCIKEARKSLDEAEIKHKDISDDDLKGFVSDYVLDSMIDRKNFVQTFM